jgi:pyruvate kinase
MLSCLHTFSSVEIVKQHGYLKDGDLTVITAGVPLGTSGTTNIIKVHITGKQY